MFNVSTQNIIYQNVLAHILILKWIKRLEILFIFKLHFNISYKIKNIILFYYIWTILLTKMRDTIVAIVDFLFLVLKSCIACIVLLWFALFHFILFCLMFFKIKNCIFSLKLNLLVLLHLDILNWFVGFHRRILLILSNKSVTI